MDVIRRYGKSSRWQIVVAFPNWITRLNQASARKLCDIIADLLEDAEEAQSGRWHGKRTTCGGLQISKLRPDGTAIDTDTPVVLGKAQAEYLEQILDEALNLKEEQR
ncbi:hypothetical protein [Nocardia sp. NPDC051832]|uniref:hypothetical protein n=1 Tax=Nocardia sp. NPDC051832 TaxID=3155673 RepID=UPI003417E064